jgi:hypothetical protein
MNEAGVRNYNFNNIFVTKCAIAILKRSNYDALTLIPLIRLLSKSIFNGTIEGIIISGDFAQLQNCKLRLCQNQH